jgi:CBS domain-containing protein
LEQQTMAQSPEIKATNTSNETAPASETDRKIHAAAGQATAAERNAASAVQTTVRHGSEATRQASRQFGETLREGGHAGVQAADSAAQIGAETARRSTYALVEGQRQLLEDMAERFESFGQQMARSMQESTSDLRSLVLPPVAATDSLRDLQDGIAGLVSGVVRSNVRASQAVLRMMDPAAMFDVQRRALREYLDTMLRSTSAFIRVSRETAEQTLRPIEARIEARQRYQEHYGRGDSGQRNSDHSVVADVMSSDVRVVTPDDTVQQATRLMRDEDTGVLPVGEGDKLVGIVTDRDVTLRLVAEGKDPARTKVREVMTQDVKYVFEDEALDHVADNMAEQQVRRLPVVNRNKRLVGVVSIGDLSRGSRAGQYAGRAMRGVARDTVRQSSTAAE